MYAGKRPRLSDLEIYWKNHPMETAHWISKDQPQARMFLWVKANNFLPLATQVIYFFF
jgi:hypothetical protein